MFRRLLDFSLQEEYYCSIVQRYEAFRAGSGDSLDDAFASLSLNRTSGNNSLHHNGPAEMTPAHVKISQRSKSEPRELSILVMSMRKLREAIVSSGRKDTFALQTYMFIVRATILAKHMESYYPAILYLLRVIHRVTPLAAIEYHELVGYYILDLVCRQNDAGAAYHVKYHYNYDGNQVEAVIKASVHGDWFSFWKIEPMVTLYQRCLMDWKADQMRSLAVECLAKSYLSVDRTYLERAVHCRWEELVERNSVGWQLEGEAVIIRRIKAK